MVRNSPSCCVTACTHVTAGSAEAVYAPTLRSSDRRGVPLHACGRPMAGGGGSEAARRRCTQAWQSSTRMHCTRPWSGIGRLSFETFTAFHTVFRSRSHALQSRHHHLDGCEHAHVPTVCSCGPASCTSFLFRYRCPHTTIAVIQERYHQITSRSITFLRLSRKNDGQRRLDD